MSPKAKAPKLEAFLEHLKIVASPRDDWKSFSVGSTGLVPIDALVTPIASIVHQLPRVAVVARRNGPADAKVSVYRFDPVDEEPWNADHYSVWLDLRSHVDFPSLVNRLSTSDDANMAEYLLERVHWQKDVRDPNDHWLTFDELPPLVQSLVGSSS